MKIAVIFFSATKNTAKMARFIIEQLKLFDKSNQINEVDVSSHSSRLRKLDVNNYDAIYFGFPIHALRAPEVVRKWLKTLEGKKKRCSVFFTYGGVDAGIAHSDMKHILDEQDFQLVSTAEFVSKHSYNLGGWNLAHNRPNEFDFEVARQYVKKTQNLFLDNGFINLQFEKTRLPEPVLFKIKESLKKSILPPSRKGSNCSLCNICEELCPTLAMDSKLGEADFEACIRCFRCFANCPENALKIGDLRRQLRLFEKVKKISSDDILTKESRFFI
ncbi:MAG: EFR1 family ferrodoxin [Candidatus Lokiarchaeota archaeon]|nr:EFR1 family ferrodoxin [Candidatus Lokiarchaeota archaeon]